MNKSLKYLKYLIIYFLVTNYRALNFNDKKF